MEVRNQVINEGPVERKGPGPFITRLVRRLADGSHLVACSRRHRKGLQPHRVPDLESTRRPTPTHFTAFAHLWAPERLAWWIAILFAVGAALFTLGGLAAMWPSAFPGVLQDETVLGRVFVVGAVFFTAGGWLQWLESVNGDVSEALVSRSVVHWRWFGWRPRNLGYLASLIQLVGTILFNFNTIDATLNGLSPQQEAWLVWAPNLLGSVCFLVASGLVYIEVSHGVTAAAPRSVSWWIAVVNLLGSVAFQISAVCSGVLPGQNAEVFLFWANLCTAFGGACFFIASYLMLPELFDEKQQGMVVPS